MNKFSLFVLFSYLLIINTSCATKNISKSGDIHSVCYKNGIINFEEVISYEADIRKEKKYLRNTKKITQERHFKNDLLLKEIFYDAYGRVRYEFIPSDEFMAPFNCVSASGEYVLCVGAPGTITTYDQSGKIIFIKTYDYPEINDNHSFIRLYAIDLGFPAPSTSENAKSATDLKNDVTVTECYINGKISEESIELNIISDDKEIFSPYIRNIYDIKTGKLIKKEYSNKLEIIKTIQYE